ncbi:MAG: redox-regulated ATPase YchF [Anaerolineae bacterium]|jgi:GTP-binding protein YchF
MALELGLVGLPNVGKSTLFNALTHAGAAVASYPFTTIDPNVGVVPLADPRLDRLGEIIRPERLVPTALRVVDIAGLVKGASEGEGLGNQFLSHVRNVDAIGMVVRCFRDDNVPHVTATLDPIGDIEVIATELALADLTILDRHLERLRSAAKGNPRAYAERVAACERGLELLSQGQALYGAAADEGERAAWAEPDLITTKPMLYLANVSESDLPAGGPLAEQVCAYARDHDAEAVVLCAALEAELADWEPDEARTMLAEYGLEATGLQRFVWAGYRLLHLLTFFTTTGGHEVRAWTLRQGQTAIEAAEQIHTDLARGFIRAEVVPYDDLDRAGSLAHAREQGQLRLEGRDYVIADGDVVHIRFNV